MEHEYYEHLAKNEVDPKKKLYLKQEVTKLKDFEPIMSKAKAILAISQKDYEYFSERFKNVHKVTAYNAYTEVDILEGSSDYVLYHGNLSVAENYSAAEYLVAFAFTLNNELPEIECSIKKGETTTKGFDISFNAGVIY